MSHAGPRHAASRPRLPLLDQLLDESPVDTPLGVGQAMAVLRAGVRRDLEALLNARRRWRSLPPHLHELAVSSVGYGLPDFTTGVLNEPRQREALRGEIEAAIRRFEPRLIGVRVHCLDPVDAREPRLRLRIEALLQAEPGDEPVTFETVLDTTTSDVILREGSAHHDV